MKMMDIGWAAGLIEGEGCIVVSDSVRNGGPSRTLRLSIEMTDLDVLQKFCSFFPTARLSKRTVKFKNPAHRDRYIVHLTGSPMAGLLMTIYPLMSERRKAKIEEAIALFKQMRSYRGHKKCAVASGSIDVVYP